MMTVVQSDRSIGTQRRLNVENFLTDDYVHCR
jgi:hypothetical protein